MKLGWTTRENLSKPSSTCLVSTGPRGLLTMTTTTSSKGFPIANLHQLCCDRQLRLFQINMIFHEQISILFQNIRVVLNQAKHGGQCILRGISRRLIFKMDWMSWATRFGEVNHQGETPLPVLLSFEHSNMQGCSKLWIHRYRVLQDHAIYQGSG